MLAKIAATVGAILMARIIEVAQPRLEEAVADSFRKAQDKIEGMADGHA